MDAVLARKAEFAVLPVSEILFAPGLRVAGTFPPDSDAHVVMEVAASVSAAAIPHVHDFIASITSERFGGLLAKHGFERR
jgi:hypothetical protein